MKRMLLPLILLCSVPFNTSCITDITFKVNVVYGEEGNTHCNWEKPVKKATRAKDYTIKFTVDEGWNLYQDENCFIISTDKLILLQPLQWVYIDGTLTIKGQFVNSNMEISVIPLQDELTK